MGGGYWYWEALGTRDEKEHMWMVMEHRTHRGNTFSPDAGCVRLKENVFLLIL